MLPSLNYRITMNTLIKTLHQCVRNKMTIQEIQRHLRGQYGLKMAKTLIQEHLKAIIAPSV